MTDPTDPPPPATLPEIIDRVVEAAEADIVDLDTVLRSFGRASFTPILLLPAIAVATPLSGIPFFSALMGILIVLVSSQMLLRRRYLWLPQWILRREVAGDRIRAAFTRIRPIGVWIDQHTAQRFRAFVTQPFILVPQVLCLLSGLSMPVLEFVPFSSSILGVGVIFLALGMLTRDGVVVLLALLPYAGVGYLVSRFLGA